MPFERVVIANDGSAAALQAVRLARRLAGPRAELRAVTVAETHLAVRAGLGAVEWDKRLRAEAEDARLAAERELRGEAHAEARVSVGRAAETILAVLDELNADLVAVGSHGHRRVAGIALGSIATRLIHDAPCSVLVAREQAPSPEDFPRSIVVGFDGSPSSVEAGSVAEALATATGAAVRRVTAGGERLPDNAIPPAELDSRPPVEALVDASRSSDLLVVGSRGLSGLAALGSVAERVAHEAACSVLIVR